MPDKQEIPIAEERGHDGLTGKERFEQMTRPTPKDWKDELISTLAHQLSQEKERNAALCEWLGDLYDRWENGTPCYEDPEESSGFLGNAFKLEADEEDALLKMLPPIAPSVALKSENARLTEALRVKEEECERLRDRERDVCAAVTRQCDVKKINEIMQDTLKARDDRALLAARRTQERGSR